MKITVERVRADGVYPDHWVVSGHQHEAAWTDEAAVALVDAEIQETIRQEQGRTMTVRGVTRERGYLG